MHPTRTVALAAVAGMLATTAFAPSRGTGLDTRELATAGGTVTVVTDGDPTTLQPVVLLVGADASATADAYAAQPTADLLAFAAVETDCGDVGGPQDAARISSVAAALATADGIDGQVALRGDGALAGLQVLAAAADPAATPAIAAVVTDNAVTDPYDLLFSQGGVARAQDAADALPCTTAGATDGVRDTWWAARQLTDGRGIAVATYTASARDAAVPDRQSIALVESLFAAEGGTAVPRSVESRGAAADGPDEGAIAEFLQLVLLPPDGHTVWVSHGSSVVVAGPCVVGLCPTSSTRSAGGGLAFPGTTTSLFLNRTFEQDLDCTPACVPGPGTGEDGTLETVNRFESPWAPQFTWVGTPVDSERLTMGDPLNDGSGVGGVEELPGGHGYHSLAYATRPLAEWTDIRGTVVLDGFFSTGSAGGTVTPILVAVDRREVPGTDSVFVIARGALDLDFAAGLDERAHRSGWKAGTIRFDAVDVPVPPGYRLEVILQSGNVEHFAPGTAQPTVNVAMGPIEGVTEVGSVLHVPTVRPLVLED